MILWLGLFLLLSGCQEKRVSLMNAPLDSGADVPIPPTQKELLTSKSFVAFIPVQFSENLSRYHKALSVSFVQSVLEEHGDLAIIDNLRVERALNRSEFSQLRSSLQQSKLRQFEDTLIKQTIELGKWLRVRYIVLMRVQPSPEKVSANDWSTFIRFRIYRVEDPVKNEMNHEFTFVFSQSNDLWEELGSLVRGRFPLGGFIIESRANRAYVRINLGRRNRIAVDQECKIFRRVRTKKKGTNGSVISSIEFNRIGQLKLFRVQDDFSWGKVPSNFRGAILKGDAVRCY
ncbi:MAG: hypothetical protein H8E38_01240 [SAR324 cluster bacterium]|nr:hypothetical protein [SAR324 cluster bacterium]MBL7034578.1 hypothetical protein [SAR324 cluster bacterium]